MLYCHQCGKQISEEDAFCGSCGAKISKISNAPSDAAPVSAASPITKDSGASSEEEYVKQFIGSKYSYFASKYAVAEKNNKMSWNWAGLIFNFMWLAYRKMYKFSYAFIALVVIETLIQSIFNISDKLINSINLSIAVMIGYYGNYYYMLHARNKVKEIVATCNPEQVSNELARQGGTSYPAAIISFVALMAAAGTAEFAPGFISGFVPAFMASYQKSAAKNTQPDPAATVATEQVRPQAETIKPPQPEPMTRTIPAEAAAPEVATEQMGPQDVTAKLSESARVMLFKAAGFTFRGNDPINACNEAADIRVEAADLNGDGVPEIFIWDTSSACYGMAGAQLVLLIKDAQGRWQSNLNFSASSFNILKTKSQGFPDIEIGGPGTCSPVWRWDGSRYEIYKKCDPYVPKSDES